MTTPAPTSKTSAKTSAKKSPNFVGHPYRTGNAWHIVRSTGTLTDRGRTFDTVTTFCNSSESILSLIRSWTGSGRPPRICKRCQNNAASHGTPIPTGP